MIYLDSSVLLAQLLMEERRPPDSFWRHPLTSSRLLVYEVWVRIHARGVREAQYGEVRHALARVNLVEMTEVALARALRPVPVTLRTLDALHLATLDYLQSQRETVELASYDNRLIAAAQALGFSLAAL